MPDYAIFRSDGSFAYRATGAAAVPDAGTGHTAVAIDGTFDPSANSYTLVNGAIAAAAIDPMVGARAAKVASAQSVFDGLIAAGFTYSGVRYQIDSDSQTQIAAMGLMALGSITDPTNSPWPAGFYWVAADNSHVPMDAPTTYAFGRAVAAYVSACILRLRALKDAIAAAADQPTLAAIDVTAGYPTPTA